MYARKASDNEIATITMAESFYTPFLNWILKITEKLDSLEGTASYIYDFMHHVTVTKEGLVAVVKLG